MTYLDTPSPVFTVLAQVDAHLDGEVALPYKEQPLAQDWARVGKVVEEAETVHCPGYVADEPLGAPR